MRGIEAVVPGRMLRIRRCDEGRPARIGGRRRVPVLTRARNRVPWPPEVVVVLVIPAVDRRIRAAEVLQRQEPRRIGGLQAVSCDELAGDLVPAQAWRALPPLG